MNGLALEFVPPLEELLVDQQRARVFAKLAETVPTPGNNSFKDSIARLTIEIVRLRDCPEYVPGEVELVSEPRERPLKFESQIAKEHKPQFLAEHLAEIVTHALFLAEANLQSWHEDWVTGQFSELLDRVLDALEQPRL
ncbi:MAG: hypothetical protein AAF432_04770 [Planctomycetota bacterium]